MDVLPAAAASLPCLPSALRRPPGGPGGTASASPYTRLANIAEHEAAPGVGVGGDAVVGVEAALRRCRSQVAIPRALVGAPSAAWGPSPAWWPRAAGRTGTLMSPTRQGDDESTLF